MDEFLDDLHRLTRDPDVHLAVYAPGRGPVAAIFGPNPVPIERRGANWEPLLFVVYAAKVRCIVTASAELLGLDWRVDLDSNGIIGLEIHGFLETFLPHYPEARVFAQRASIPEDLVEQSLAKADKASRDRREFFAISEQVRACTESLTSYAPLSTQIERAAHTALL